MNFEHTALYRECEQILNSKEDPVTFYYALEIKTPMGVHKPSKLMSISINSDYVRDYAPKMIATMVFPYGEFNHKIRPYFEDLTVLIRKSPDQLYKSKNEIDVQRYRGILVDIPQAPNMSGTVQEGSEDFGDLSQMVQVDIELQEFMLEEIRAITTGGIIQATSPAAALSSIVTTFTNNLSLSMDESAVSFDMQPPKNTTPQQQITIPQSVELTSLADFLQVRGGGIYNHDIASFLQRGSWYVWSPFDTSRQDYVEDTLVVVLAPIRKYDGVERTYRTTTRQTIMMVTGERSHTDTSQNDLYNKGTGIRFLNAMSALEGFAEVVANTVKVDRSKNATEIAYDVSPTGKSRVRTVAPTSNIYHELSKVAPSKGSFLSVTWSNADNDLIRPDMNVQVMMNESGVTKVYQARILACNTFIQNTGTGMMANRFSTGIALSLFIDEEFSKEDLVELDTVAESDAKLEEEVVKEAKETTVKEMMFSKEIKSVYSEIRGVYGDVKGVYDDLHGTYKEITDTFSEEDLKELKRHLSSIKG